MGKLKLKKNDFGLRVACSICNTAFNQTSIKNCRHYDKQKYRVLVYLHDGSTKIKTLKTKDYNAAVEEAIKFKNQIKSGEQIVITKKKQSNSNDLLLLKAADEFINEKKGNVKFSYMKKPELTSDYVDSILQYLTEFIKILTKKGYSVNQMNVGDVNEEHIEEWWVDLNKKYDNPSTINARIRALRGFYNFLNKRKNIKVKNHFLDVELLNELNEIKSISKQEFEGLCDAVENMSPYHNFLTKKGVENRRNRYRPYLINAFKLGLYTGLRREEIFNLKWSNIKKREDGKLLFAVPNLKVERITKKKFRLKYVPLYSDLYNFLSDLGLDSKINSDEYILFPERKETIKTLTECTSKLSHTIIRKLTH